MCAGLEVNVFIASFIWVEEHITMAVIRCA